MKAGLAIKPKTLIDHTITSILDKNLIDMVLIMTVGKFFFPLLLHFPFILKEPGFGGQSFMGDMMSKVKQLRKQYKNLYIEVDGGVKCENVDLAAEAGANVIVSGTGIFQHSDPEYAIKFMRETVQKYL